jgi:hypothetical protein
MQKLLPAWACSVDTQHGHAVWTFSMHVQYGHAARTCMQQGHHYGHIALACSVDMQKVYAA